MSKFMYVQGANAQKLKPRLKNRMDQVSERRPGPLANAAQDGHADLRRFVFGIFSACSI
jgi:hypothetical protein